MADKQPAAPVTHMNPRIERDRRMITDARAQGRGAMFKTFVRLSGSGLAPERHHAGRRVVVVVPVPRDACRIQLSVAPAAGDDPGHRHAQRDRLRDALDGAAAGAGDQ